MIDLYLRTSTQEEMREALLVAGFSRTKDGRLWHPAIHLDEVGVIYKPTGKTLKAPNGSEFPEHAPIFGWHVNLRIMDDSLAPSFFNLSCDCSTPSRVWA